MKLGFKSFLYLLAVVLLVAGSSARAQAPDACWREVNLAGDSLVELHPTGDERPELNFRSSSNVTVEVPGSPDTPETIAASEIVQLDTSTGQVEIEKGPLELASDNGRYAVPADPTKLSLRLAAIEGTRIKLSEEVTGGQLPANKSAEIVLEDGPIQAQLVASVWLKPIPPADPLARLDVGVLPITRGGRTLQVELYASPWNQDQLSEETFQACFYYDPPEPVSSSDSSDTIIPATMANVVSARDGRVTLIVPVPDELDRNTKFYNAVQLQILGPTLGILSGPEKVRIGNPIIAFLVSVLIVVGLLWIVARLLPTTVTTGNVFQKLFSFTIGVDGQPSLSLFQMYIWTALVLVGMFYVFFMSGDLLNVSQQVLVLVGLAGLGSISARWISTGTSGAAPPTGAGFWGMFVVDNKPDLLRLQLFLFTLAIWIYVAARVFYEQEFPELTTEVLLLMGISNGVYVGAKWATTGDPTATLRKLRMDLDEWRQAEEVKAAEIKDLEAKVAELTDPNTKQAKAGKEQEFKTASADLEVKRGELKKLTDTRDKAEKDYKAEIERLGKA